jgi:hypothetical protein
MITTKLNHEATLYTPEDANETELIVLCTWLGAPRKIFPKYISMYQSITPRTPILLIESSIWTITPTYATQKRKAAEAVTVVQHTLSVAKEKHIDPKIMLHTFSGGGSNSVTQLLLAYQEKTGKALPLQGTICDSGPAKGEYWKAYNAIRLSLPRTTLYNWIGPVISHFIPGYMFINAAMGRYETFQNLVRMTLLDPKCMGTREGGENGERRMTLIWSKEDDYVDWQDLVEYVEEADGKGWVAKSEEFVGSAHCAHFRLDGKRYAEISRAMWEA